jgi:hypothetical protein
MDYRERLLRAADAFCKKRNIARATASTLVANDGKFLDRIASGAGCTVKRFDRVMARLQGRAPLYERNPTSGEAA